MKSDESRSKKIIFVIVVFLFLVSTLVVIISLGQNTRKSSADDELGLQIMETDNAEEGDSSLEEYFEGVSGEVIKESPNFTYLETDPFKKTCLTEGGTFGTKCYY